MPPATRAMRDPAGSGAVRAWTSLRITHPETQPSNTEPDGGSAAPEKQGEHARRTSFTRPRQDAEGRGRSGVIQGR